MGTGGLSMQFPFDIRLAKASFLDDSFVDI